MAISPSATRLLHDQGFVFARELLGYGVQKITDIEEWALDNADLVRRVGPRGDLAPSGEGEIAIHIEDIPRILPRINLDTLSSALEVTRAPKTPTTDPPSPMFSPDDLDYVQLLKTIPSMLSSTDSGSTESLSPVEPVSPAETPELTVRFLALLKEREWSMGTFLSLYSDKISSSTCYKVARGDQVGSSIARKMNSILDSISQKPSLPPAPPALPALPAPPAPPALPSLPTSVPTNPSPIDSSHGINISRFEGTVKITSSSPGGHGVLRIEGPTSVEVHLGPGIRIVSSVSASGSPLLEISISP